MPALTRVEICIVGGGPAGSVAARLLASWGRSVVLLHRPPSTPPLAESLPPSTRKLLALVGIEAAIDAVPSVPNTGNTARWAGRDHRSVSTAAGYHVSRDVWDAALLDTARQAGATVIAARVRQVDPIGARVIAVDPAGRELLLEPEYVLDCSGRSGLVARQGLRRRSADYRTVAIAAEWHAPQWPSAERTQTVVESYDEGWAWSVPLPNDTRQCTVMIDPRRVDHARSSEGLSTRGTSAALLRLYDAELGRTVVLRERLREARRTGRVWACDASLYDCVRAAEGRAILVGDAASFIEPLSSAGVKKAMLSGWRAAIVANTCLKTEGSQSIAFDYHNAREAEVFRSCARHAARFFSDAASTHRSPFWDARSACNAPPAADGSEPLADGEIVSAFERLQMHGRLRVAPGICREQAPIIEGNEIVLGEALRLPGFAEPVRFVSNVNLPALVNIVGRHDDVESALAAYGSEVHPIAPGDLLRGLSLLVARRAILHEGVRP